MFVFAFEADDRAYRRSCRIMRHLRENFPIILSINWIAISMLN